MKILEDFKEILYDILGFVLPGMFAMIIFIPMMFFSNNETWSNFVIKALKGIIEKLGLGIEVEKTNQLIDIITGDLFSNFLSQNKILIMVFFIAMAYLMGCAVHFGAKKYYQMMYLIMEMKGLAEIDEYDKAQVRLLANEKKNNKFLESTLENKTSSKRVESVIRYTLRRNDNASLVGKYIGKYNFFMSFSFLFLMVSMFFIEKNFALIGIVAFVILHIPSRVIFKIIENNKKSYEKELKRGNNEVDKLKKELKNTSYINILKLNKVNKLIERNRHYEKKIKNLKFIELFKIGVVLFVIIFFRKYYLFFVTYIIHLGLNSEYIRHYNLSKKEAFLGMADYLSK